MARPVTADLRGVQDDGRRWWAVISDQLGAPWFYPARSGREAVAAHRRDSVNADVANGFSRRHATDLVRASNLTHRGPYTAREAFVIDAGWTLAWDTCTGFRSDSAVPGGPIEDLDDCRPILTDAQVERRLDTVAEHYRPELTYLKGGESMEDEEDDEVVYACDDCGEEFDSQVALDGHEAEGCWAAPDAS